MWMPYAVYQMMNISNKKNDAWMKTRHKSSNRKKKKKKKNLKQIKMEEMKMLTNININIIAKPLPTVTKVSTAANQ